MKHDSASHLPLPFTRDLVLVGGGHTHALFLRAWGMSPLAGARVTLITPESAAAYSGMLPGHVAGHYTRDQLDIDLVRLARFSGVRVVMGYATGIDLEHRTIDVAGRPPIAFDVASFDVGITSKMPNLEGFTEFGTPAKPLGMFADRWAAYLARPEPAQIAILGGGIAGAELALAMAHALERRERRGQITLIDRSKTLDGVLLKTARTIRSALHAANVAVVEGVEVERIEQDRVCLTNGESIPAHFVCGAAGAHPHDWLANTGLTNDNGFVSVNRYLQSSDPDVFAVGDCAHMSESPRPKAGVYAVRQAPILLKNIRARLEGAKATVPYTPQGDYLKLVSLGAQKAVGDRFGITLSGSMIWQLKDRIDQAFMHKFSDYPTMPTPAVPAPHAAGLIEALGPKPMCGGCGSKLGPAALQAGLGANSISSRPDITMLPGDDAAELTVGSARMVISTDHLRAFVKDPVVMTRIAATHALGDIWAMGATPFAATSTVLLPPMSSELASRTLAEISLTARQVMQEAGADIVGGHSSTSAELTLGFTVTGLCDQAPITLGGARPGDHLILTKPIGTGVIMAAEMQMQAKGTWVISAIDHMSQLQSTASHMLRKAHAMTDVTGFGLIGHVSNICTASHVGAEICLQDVPLLPGATELSVSGVRSSLFSQNVSSFPHIARDPIADLLFDPQTSGGLLAAVGEDPNALIAELRSNGINAVCIGRITDQAGHISIV